MAFFDGLYSYEIIILVAGALLFVVLLAALLRKVFTDESYVGLLPFFVLTVIMIGFPAWSSVKVSDGVIEINKQAHELAAHPDDAALRGTLEANVSKLSTRPFKSPQTVATLAEAQFALGQDDQAKQNLNKALAADPTLKPAQDLKAKVDLTTKLSALTAAAQQKPDDPQVKQELQNTVQQASHYKFANPTAVNNIKKATVILQKPVSGGVAPGHVNPAMLAVPAGGLNINH